MAETPVSKSRLSWPLRLVFALSLALNLLFVGAILGAWWRGGPPAGPELAGQAGALYRALPDDVQRDLRAEMRGKLDRDRRRAIRVRGPLLEVLRAEPFDAVAAAAILDAQIGALTGAQRQMNTLWLDRIAAMSPADRAAYAERLDAEWARRRK